jgi:hypothetical protein
MNLEQIREYAARETKLEGEKPLRAIARDELKNDQRVNGRDREYNWLYFAGIIVIVLALAISALTTERQASWEDEIFVVSTGWSIARSQPPILSVLAQYPGTGSPIKFYGPVSFEAEASLIRLFGLSLSLWRMACVAGVAFSIWASMRLVNAAGGDKWARLITGLIIALSGSLAPFPGRWDAVTSGLFLTGLLFFLRGVEYDGSALLWRAAAGGIFIGVSLASSPRALTLVSAAVVASVLVMLCFRRVSKRFFLGSLCMFSVATLTQTVLLSPWGENSVSWYLYLKRATRADTINATPLVGQGNWNPDLHHHKTLVVLLSIFLLIFTYQVISQWVPRAYPTKLPLKLFLTFFAVSNLFLMLLLLANSLGQSPFWLPPALAAFTCWIDWSFSRDRKLGVVTITLIGVCVLLLVFQQVEQSASVILTWNRRSTADLKAFVDTTLPKGATVYGPIGGYFYPVELSGRQYLYTHEQTTPGLYSVSRNPIGERLDAEICSRPTYAIWPEPDGVYPLEVEPMPDALRDRLAEKVGEFHQPPLASWKGRVLGKIGEISGKSGFPDAVAYSLRSITPCLVK